MTTYEFYHKFSVQHKLLMCLDLPRVEYRKRKANKTDVLKAKKNNERIAKTLIEKAEKAKKLDTINNLIQ